MATGSSAMAKMTCPVTFTPLAMPREFAKRDHPDRVRPADGLGAIARSGIADGGASIRANAEGLTLEYSAGQVAKPLEERRGACSRSNGADDDCDQHTSHSRRPLARIPFTTLP